MLFVSLKDTSRIGDQQREYGVGASFVLLFGLPLNTSGE